MSVYAGVRMLAYVDMCRRERAILAIHVRTGEQACGHAFVFVRACVCRHACMHVCMQVWAHVCAHMCQLLEHIIPSCMNMRADLCVDMRADMPGP